MKITDILNTLKATPAMSKLLTPQGITGALEIYSTYETATAKGGKVTPATGVELGIRALQYLNAQGVTLGDVEQIVTAAAPLIAAHAAVGTAPAQG